MTMQRHERFLYLGEDYAITAIEDFDHFHLPEPLRRLPFREPATSLHRGFVSTFSLNARHQLIVHSIDAWVSQEASLPVINGIAPVCDDGFCDTIEKEKSEPSESGQSEEDQAFIEAIFGIMESSNDDDDVKTEKRSEFFRFPKRIEYPAIDVPLNYSGRMLIGRDQLPYFRNGFLPPFYYQEVLELRFSGGYLIGAEDVSAEAKRIMQRISAQMEEARNDPEHRSIAIPMYALSEYSLDLDEKWTDRVIIWLSNKDEEELANDEPEQREAEENPAPADSGDRITYYF